MSALDQLAEVARAYLGHVTIHVSYGPEAERHPEPDWACQLIFTGTARFPDGDKPHVFNWYSSGGTLDEAAQAVLDQITLAANASARHQEPPA